MKSFARMPAVTHAVDIRARQWKACTLSIIMNHSNRQINAVSTDAA